MSIVIISGAAKSGKSLIANALRNNQLAHKRGALLIDDQSEGDIAPLLEKILLGVTLDSLKGKAVADMPWKPNSIVIVVGEKGRVFLDRVEKYLPGFIAHLGPVYRIDCAAPPPAPPKG